MDPTETDFFVSITDQDGVLLDRFSIAGYNLDRQRDRVDLGERVASSMGGRAVRVCAALTPDDADDEG